LLPIQGDKERYCCLRHCGSNIKRRSRTSQFRDGIVIDGTGDGNALNVSNNNVNNYTAFGILLSNSSNGTIIKGNRLFTSGATANGIDLSAAIFFVSATSNTVRQTASANCINVNTSLTSNNYQVSYNTVFGGTVTDGGPGGATKNITGNW
jgi:hypothetical protein